MFPESLPNNVPLPFKELNKIMFWNGLSPDLNPIEMRWKDLKQAAHAKRPTNVPELRLFCKEGWAKV